MIAEVLPWREVEEKFREEACERRSVGAGLQELATGDR